ncbi:MAG: cysteine hydrolase [Candidatus Scalindua sp.]|nr:cysteine hydrolase [Candidatus Scalindua sp.]MCR4344002.1 cysteine hydrolase [Candidatus Scalindua sp.]
MKQTSLILIDPQIGFCSPTGSLGKEYGVGEICEIRRVIPNIKKALSESSRQHVVSSSYSVAQFTNGNTNHGLANLCVPDINSDCAIIDEFSEVEFNSYSIKHEQSALSSSVFVKEIDNDIRLGIERFVVAGFLLEHCVKKTAEDLKKHLINTNTKVFFCNDLSASRLEKYKNGIVADTIKSLNSNGVQTESWQSIRT